MLDTTSLSPGSFSDRQRKRNQEPLRGSRTCKVLSHPEAPFLFVCLYPGLAWVLVSSVLSNSSLFLSRSSSSSFLSRSSTIHTFYRLPAFIPALLQPQHTSYRGPRQTAAWRTIVLSLSVCFPALVTSSQY